MFIAISCICGINWKIFTTEWAALVLKLNKAALWHTVASDMHLLHTKDW